MSSPGIITTGVVGLAVGFSLVWTGADFAKTPERHLDVADLSYVVLEGKGHVRQQIVSTEGPISADWRASIQRRTPIGGDEVLCAGSGEGNYSGEVSIWDLDTWTGDDCPEVANIGDIFEVSWTYINAYGFRVSIGGRYALFADNSLELIP